VNIKVNIWDFGGQEIYHSTHQCFFTKRSFYILVLNNRNNEQQNRIEYWLELVQQLGNNSPIIIVGNNSDEHPLDINKGFYINQFPKLFSYLDKTEQKNAIIEVSCKNGHNIATLKQSICDAISKLEVLKVAENKIDNWANWLKVKTELEEEKSKNLDYISYAEYEEICQRNNVIDSVEQRELIKYLNDLGVVLYFYDNEKDNTEHTDDKNELKKIAIFNPVWITKGIYKLITAENLKIYNGLVPEENLKSSLIEDRKYNDSNYRVILEMMTKFSLCFKIPDSSEIEYLIPSLLPKDQSQHQDLINELNSQDSLKFQYHYSIFAEIIITRFIVQANKYIYINQSGQRICWRTGVILKYTENGNEANALVQADVEKQKIYIYIKTTKGEQQYKRVFRKKIKEFLDDSHKTFPDYPDFVEYLTIPNRPELKPIDYKSLKQRHELGEIKYYPDHAGDNPIDIEETLSLFDECSPHNRFLDWRRSPILNLIKSINLFFSKPYHFS
jgi:GTPase SAR1 family protein